MVPVVWHSFVPPRPLVTWRLIEASFAPLWPGSRNTVIPAIADAAAIGAATVDRLSTTGAAAAYLSMSRRESARHRAHTQQPQVAQRHGRTARAGAGPGARRPGPAETTRYAILPRLLPFSTMRIIFIRRSK